MGNDTVHLAANEEIPHLSWSNDAKVNYPNVPEAQMHRLIAYVILVAAGELIFLCSFFNQRFWLFISICSHLNWLLHCIALSRKLSWIRRKVYFDAIIIVSTLLLDFLEETLIVKKTFQKDFFLMASYLVYIGRFLFCSKQMSKLSQLQIKKFEFTHNYFPCRFLNEQR